MPDDLDDEGAAPAEHSDELTIELKRPIKHGGVEYAKLDLSEPSAEHMMQCDQFAGYTWAANIVSRSSAVPLNAIKQLPVSTLMKAADFVLGFIDGGLPTTRAA